MYSKSEIIIMIFRDYRLKVSQYTNRCTIYSSGLNPKMRYRRTSLLFPLPIVVIGFLSSQMISLLVTIINFWSFTPIAKANCNKNYSNMLVLVD
jgi:K+-sensing histidine kinase KdpD